MCDERVVGLLTQIRDLLAAQHDVRPDDAESDRTEVRGD